MQKSVELQSNGLTLRGMLHVPEEVNQKIPMVCIFHGFTGNKMEPHFIFVKLSRMLEANGIASVRFDFGGSGESDGDFVNMTLSKELNDAKNILDYVKALDFVDNNRIGIVGLSMGGAVASMLAGDRKEDIGSLCLWAPAGVMKELIIQGLGEEGLNTIETIGYSDVGGLFIGLDFVHDIMTLDIYKKAALYDKRVLILHGDKDPTVPITASQKYLEIYGAKATLNIISGAGHTFNSCTWASEVLETTLEFLKNDLKV